MAASANVDTPARGDVRGLQHFPCDGGAQTLYIGQFVMQDATGYVVTAASTAACRFLGVARDKIVIASTETDGTTKIQVQTKGEVKATVTSVAATSVGMPVWLTDSNTLQLTPTEIFVGYVTEYVSSNTAWVMLCPDMVPRRVDITLAVPTSAASSTKSSCRHTFRRTTAILAAYVNANTYPDYATSVIDVDKYDLSGTADVAVVNATDIDGKTAKTAIDLTVVTAASANLCDPGDSVVASQTLGATEATASDGVSVTLECVEYGMPNQ